MIPSGGYVSNAWPYEMSDFANGTITPSGILASTANHLTIQQQDMWYNWNFIRQYDSGYLDTTLQFVTANQASIIPPALFALCESARIAVTDGSGSGILQTAQVVFTVKLKS